MWRTEYILAATPVFVPPPLSTSIEPHFGQSPSSLFSFALAVPSEAQTPLFIESANRQFHQLMTNISTRHNNTASLATCLLSIKINLHLTTIPKVGRDSSVGIMTRYGLDGPGFSALYQICPEVHLASRSAL